MRSSLPKGVLFSSQSFYPSVGGVSTLLLALARQLERQKYRVHSIHLAMPIPPGSQHAQHRIREHVIQRDSISADVYEGYAAFKEIVYQHLHGLGTFPYAHIADVPGYDAYMQLSATYSDKLRDVLITEDIDLIHFHDYQVMPGIAAAPSDIPCLFSLHAPIVPSLSPVLRDWLLEYWTVSRAVIFAIPAYAELACAWGLDPRKAAVIPPIIDTSVLAGC